MPVSPEMASLLEGSVAADMMDERVQLAKKLGVSLQAADDLIKEKPVNPFAARFPAVEKAAEQYAIPTATAVAGMFPGSLAVQSLIGAGGEALNQAVQGKFDPTAIGIAGALPAGVRGLGQAVKAGARGLAKVAGKEGVAQAGDEVLKESLGYTPGAGSAAFTATKASTQPVNLMPETANAVIGAIQKHGRIGTLKNAMDDIQDLVQRHAMATAAGKPLEYGEIFEKATQLNQRAGQLMANDSAAGNALKDVRNAMLNDLAKVSREAGDAVKIYRREKAIEDISHGMNRANSGRYIKDLLEEKMVAGAFSETEKKTIQLIANQIGPEGLGKTALALGTLGLGGYGTAGAGGAAAASLVPVIVGAIVNSGGPGQAIARSLIGPEGKISKIALPALAQLVRGYMGTQPAQ